MKQIIACILLLYGAVSSASDKNMSVGVIGGWNTYYVEVESKTYGLADDSQNKESDVEQGMSIGITSSYRVKDNHVFSLSLLRDSVFTDNSSYSDVSFLSAIGAYSYQFSDSPLFLKIGGRISLPDSSIDGFEDYSYGLLAGMGFIFDIGQNLFIQTDVLLDYSPWRIYRTDDDLSITTSMSTEMWMHTARLMVSLNYYLF